MFERLSERARQAAEVRAEARRRELAAPLAAELPAGIEAAKVDGGVELTGRGLRRRLALDPELRSLIGRST
jgi:hypothetical protein